MRLDRFVSLPASLGFSAVLLVGSLVACGGGQSEAPAPKTATTSAPMPSASVAPASDLAPESAPAGTIPRSRIYRAVDAGLGAFLQHVTLDDSPVMVDGKFHGFKIDELHGHLFDGIDLKAGDVVTSINGFPIEHPEQAMEAFQSLAVASELRVDYERDGQPKELRFPILEDVAPTAGAAASADGGAPTPTKSGKAPTIRMH